MNNKNKSCDDIFIYFFFALIIIFLMKMTFEDNFQSDSEMSKKSPKDAECLFQKNVYISEPFMSSRSAQEYAPYFVGTKNTSHST